MGVISRFGQWLDKRWPEKVSISAELHMAMKEDIKTLALALDVVNARLDSFIKKQELVERKNFVSQADR